MNDHTDEIEANSLRIKLDGRYSYRKDIINRARERWHTSNKSKAVMRSADAFVDVVDELEQLLEDQDVSDLLKRELVEQFESRHLDLRRDPAVYRLELED